LFHRVLPLLALLLTMFFIAGFLMENPVFIKLKTGFGFSIIWMSFSLAEISHLT
jgi:hypothetical protein